MSFILARLEFSEEDLRKFINGTSQKRTLYNVYRACEAEGLDGRWMEEPYLRVILQRYQASLSSDCYSAAPIVTHDARDQRIMEECGVPYDPFICVRNMTQAKVLDIQMQLGAGGEEIVRYPISGRSGIALIRYDRKSYPYYGLNRFAINDSEIRPTEELMQIIKRGPKPGFLTFESFVQQEKNRMAGAKAREKVSKKPEVKNPKGQLCMCGCGGTTKGGKFLPGHDSKYHSALLKAQKAKATP